MSTTDPVQSNKVWFAKPAKVKRTRKIYGQKAPRAPQGVILGKEPDKTAVPVEQKETFNHITEYLTTGDVNWLK